MNYFGDYSELKAGFGSARVERRPGCPLSSTSPRARLGFRRNCADPLEKVAQVIGEIGERREAGPAALSADGACAGPRPFTAGGRRGCRGGLQDVSPI